MNQKSSTQRPRRLSARSRKVFLVTHILSAAMWIGVDVALGILVITALLTDDAQVAGSVLQALELFAIWPMFGASIVCLASGLVLGLGSKYGLFRYWWVVVEFAFNVAMSVMIVSSLRPGIGGAAEVGRQLAAGNLAVDLPVELLAPVFVAPTMLLIAAILSVFKPWARVGGRRSTPRDVVQQPLRDGRAVRALSGV